MLNRKDRRERRDKNRPRKFSAVSALSAVKRRSSCQAILSRAGIMFQLSTSMCRQSPSMFHRSTSASSKATIDAAVAD